MSTLIPMFVSLLIWFVLWLYIFNLDKKVRKLKKDA